MYKKKIHFICINGFSMSALASILSEHNEISGTDLRAKPIPNCKVYKQDGGLHCPPDADYVVYNTITPKDDPDYMYAKNNHIPLIHRTELLELMTNTRFKIAITGCSGKTSTSYYISQLLPESFALVGENIYNGLSYREGDGPYIVELNEADMKFSKETADILIFKNYNIDHIWLFKDEQELQDYYIELFNRCSHVIYHESIPFINRAKAYCKSTTFHKINYEVLDKKADWSSFTPTTKFKFQGCAYITHLFGEHTVHNLCDAIYAINLYKQLNHRPITPLDVNKLTHCSRRTEVLYHSPKLAIIDDQAVFYEEVKRSIDTMRIFNKPISIILCGVYNSNKQRTHYFLKEYIEIMKNTRSASYRSEVKPQYLLHNKEDLWNFLDESEGVVLLLHKLYEQLLKEVKEYISFKSLV